MIVGSGISGLRVALELDSKDVAVLSKVLPTRSHSGAAQGGVSAALGNEELDKPEWHMYDTIKGGDYLGDQDAIDFLVNDAPRALYELEHYGVPFNRNEEGKISQRYFGGHTKDFGKEPVRRACFASDRTGRAILDTLYEQCLQKNVTFYNEYHVLSLVFKKDVCCGLIAYDIMSGDIYGFNSKAVILATGGCGQLFNVTSNAFASTGDGLALAYRAGVPLEDMEFIQFHPTGIRKLGILISEAARGEGAKLVNDKGERFMERYAPTLKDLAPRDMVSRAIMQEISNGRGINGEDYVYLDLTEIGSDHIQKRLPDMKSFARIYTGVNVETEPIPVQPTCHYLMGGVPTNINGKVLDEQSKWVCGLYAVGECACVSVHGANRLGTNSLIDLVVFGSRVGKEILNDLKARHRIEMDEDTIKHIENRINQKKDCKGNRKVGQIKSTMQQVMTDGCSIFRSKEKLAVGIKKIRELQHECENVMLDDKGNRFNIELMESFELEFMIDIAEVVLESALAREESRGAHFRVDFPYRDDDRFLNHTLAKKSGDKVKVLYKPVTITRFKPKPRKY